MGDEATISYVERGRKYEDEGNYIAAIEEYTHAIEKSTTQNDLIYAMRSSAYIDSRQYDKAIEDATQAISLSSNDARHFVTRGTAYVNLGKYQEARSDWETALRLNPNDSDAKANLERLTSGGYEDTSPVYSTGKKRRLIIMAIGFVIFGVIFGIASGVWYIGLIGAFWGLGIGPFGHHFKEEVVGHLSATWDLTKTGFREDGFKQALFNLFVGFFIYGIWHLIKLGFWFLISPFVAIYQLVTDE